MFIYNVKWDKKKLLKWFWITIILLIIIICSITLFSMVKSANNQKNKNTTSINQEINHITTQNYTNVLKTVHENIPNYVGEKIHFTGYVYRVYDFTSDEFVLGRSMIINSEFQSVVVGFLCSYNKASEFADGTWVELEGTIKKGDYHGDMPIIDVTKIKTVDVPADEFVYPPDDEYLQTSTLE